MKQDNMIFINGCPLNVIDEIPDKLEIPVDKNSQQQHFKGELLHLNQLQPCHGILSFYVNLTRVRMIILKAS